MIVAVDVGNSRTKWAVFEEDGRISNQGAADNGNFLSLKAMCGHLPQQARAVMACVAGESMRDTVSSLLAEAGIAVREIVPEPRAAGVVNTYAEPRQLGVDRWAAAIAAWQMRRQACVIVNVGTALTVDALSGKGEFLGGLIVPGLRLMTGALAGGTAGIPALEGEPDCPDFPRDTLSAVYGGSLAAMAGAVRLMLERLAAREGQMPLCVCSGGDMDRLLPLLPSTTVRAPDLVLKGLFYLETLS